MKILFTFYTSSRTRSPARAFVLTTPGTGFAFSLFAHIDIKQNKTKHILDGTGADEFENDSSILLDFARLLRFDDFRAKLASGAVIMKRTPHYSP